jgi:tRNA uridine 5-carbamoylmethylation protein Kti12
MRHDALQLARRFSCAFVVLHVTAALELCLQRDARRSAAASGAAVGADVIRNISASMEVPDLAHCPWEKYTVAVTWPADATTAGESLAGSVFVLLETMLCLVVRAVLLCATCLRAWKASLHACCTSDCDTSNSLSCGLARS